MIDGPKTDHQLVPALVAGAATTKHSGCCGSGGSALLIVAVMAVMAVVYNKINQRDYISFTPCHCLIESAVWNGACFRAFVGLVPDSNALNAPSLKRADLPSPLLSRLLFPHPKLGWTHCFF
jgi:hypothetical protein